MRGRRYGVQRCGYCEFPTSEQGRTGEPACSMACSTALVMIASGISEKRVRWWWESEPKEARTPSEARIKAAEGGGGQEPRMDPDPARG